MLPTAFRLDDTDYGERARKAWETRHARGEGAAAQPSITDIMAGERLSGAKGSNEGGLYRAADGSKWYVKKYDDADQAYGEVAANTLYRALGFGAPESQVGESADGELMYASKWLPDNQGTIQDVGLTKAIADRVLDGFAVDAFTGNWDAVGLDFDNAVVNHDGSVARVDNGGTFLHRAQGSKKPESLLMKVGEWETMSDPSIAPYYAQVFEAAGIENADELGSKAVTQIDRILDIHQKSGSWRTFLSTAIPDAPPSYADKLARVLEARTKSMREIRDRLANLRADPRAINLSLFDTATSDHHGLLVSLTIPPDVAALLAIPGGESADQLHITLCYCGNVEDLGDLVVMHAVLAVEAVARGGEPLDGQVDALDRFEASESSDGKDVIIATVDIPALADFRQRIADALTEAGAPPRSNHEYRPHITLAYVDAGAPNPAVAVPTVSLAFSEITVSVGDHRVEIPLGESTRSLRAKVDGFFLTVEGAIKAAATRRANAARRANAGGAFHVHIQKGEGYDIHEKIGPFAKQEDATKAARAACTRDTGCPDADIADDSSNQGLLDYTATIYPRENRPKVVGAIGPKRHHMWRAHIIDKTQQHVPQPRVALSTDLDSAASRKAWKTRQRAKADATGDETEAETEAREISEAIGAEEAKAATPAAKVKVAGTIAVVGTGPSAIAARAALATIPDHVKALVGKLKLTVLPAAAFNRAAAMRGLDKADMVQGFYSAKEHAIMILAGGESVEATVRHEMGHAVDVALNLTGFAGDRKGDRTVHAAFKADVAGLDDETKMIYGYYAQIPTEAVAQVFQEMTAGADWFEMYPYVKNFPRLAKILKKRLKL